jgi:hypothetical protein
MIDKNHMGHEFVHNSETGNVGSRCIYYTCSKCKIIIFNTEDKYERKIFISNDWTGTPFEPNDELNLTCDEVIIKNIIE